MSDSKFTTRGDEPVEARIVAWVLGEASAFEVDELERLCEERPELAVFKRRIEAVHGLATEAHDQKEDGRWKLSIKNRASIEELIGAEEEVAEDLARETRIHASGRRQMMAIAACLVLSLVVATLTWPVIFGSKSKMESAANRGSELDAMFLEGSEADYSDDYLVLDSKVKEKSKKGDSRRPASPSNSNTKWTTNGLAPNEAVPAEEAQLAKPQLTFGSDAAYGEGWSDGKGKGQGLSEREGRGRNASKENQALPADKALAPPSAPAAVPMSPARPATVDAIGKSETSNGANDLYANKDNSGNRDRLNRAAADPTSELAADLASLSSRRPMNLSPEAIEGGQSFEDHNKLRNQTHFYRSGDLEGAGGVNAPVPAGGSAPKSFSNSASGEAPEKNIGESYQRGLLPGGNEADGQFNSRFWAQGGRGGQDENPKAKADLAEVGDIPLIGGLFADETPDLNSSLKDAEMDQLKQQIDNSVTHAQREELGKKLKAGREMLDDRKLTEATELELEFKGMKRQDELNLELESLTESLDEDRAKLEKLDEDVKDKLEERKRPVVTEEEIIAADEPYSTFSLNINDASFRVAQAALAKGEMPDPEGIKVEQFYNAVDYGDPSPAQGQPVAGSIEQTAHPVIPGRNLVRVAIKTASEGRNQGQPLRLTLLIDQSGSMAREDRRQAMVDALDGLRGLLNENDQVNVIGFSRTPRLLAEAVTGKQGQLANLLNIEANEGGTNLEEALKLGEQLAERHQLEGAQNRLVLFTDGAANLGDADPDSLSDKIKELRQKGISFDIAGIVADGLNDDLLGEMARHGNGRYYVVGKGEKNRFAEQLAGAFRPAAENVKVQVHFNPERVGRYKLIGFEKDRLNKEDFHDDTVDAAELAAEEAGVAIYQVETLPEGEGEIGEVSVRFRDVASGDMVERSWTIANEISTSALDQARPSMQLATLAMMAGEKLRGGPLADAVNFNEMAEVIAKVNQHYKGDPKAAEMLEMIEQLK